MSGNQPSDGSATHDGQARTAAAPMPARSRRWPWATAAVLGAIFGAAAIGESMGWPFLGQPLQRWMTTRLDRPVQLVGDDGRGFELHLWGPIRLSVARMRIGNPAWSGMGPMLDADTVQLSMRWGDALSWRPGGSLKLQTLTATRLDLQLQREADGRASWTLAPTRPGLPAPVPRPIADVLTVQRLAVDSGRVQLQDRLLQLQLDGQFSQSAGTAPQDGSLRGDAVGSYRGKPLRASLRAGHTGAWLADAQAADQATPFTLSVQAGRASLEFAGELRHALTEPRVSGRYRVSGPSLAAVGDPMGITLPQTRRFDMRGRLVREGPRWYTVVDQATVGGSRLGGEFIYERLPGRLPTLSGRLTGAALLLQDLGPAVGGATETEPKTVQARGRVLPDRAFSLPSLQAMNANVLVALDKLDFGTPTLKAAAPVSAMIRLDGGVLSIEELRATLAQGLLSGHVKLDGRRSPAHWDVNLVGRNLLIEQWLLAVRRKGQEPYASGRLNAQVSLTGTGNSTAELLASAQGRVRAHWRDGQISHLLVEAAGLDIAQGLGVLLTGDRPLPVNCGAADLRVKDGLATPQVLLVDTRDSLLWVDGSLSMATETLRLQAHAQPKDWSPLSLRTPLHIDGTLGAPALSLDKPKLLQRAVPAALLALIHPLAALLPLMDTGEKEGPKASSCRDLVRRFTATGFEGTRP